MRDSEESVRGLVLTANCGVLSSLFGHPIEQAADGLHRIFNLLAAAFDSGIGSAGRQKRCSSHYDSQLIINGVNDLFCRHRVRSFQRKISSAWLRAIHLNLEESQHSFVQNREILTIFFDLFQKPEE